MKQKIFLTSALAMGFVAPAVAVPTYTSETFPSTGLMQADYTYEGAATFENTGVYDGEVDATAEYDNTPYSVAAGLYFTGVDNSNEAITATCTAGSYCPGVTSTTYDYTTGLFGNAGIQSCPTIDDTQFTSASGSSAVTNCYDENTAMSSAELNPFTTAHLNTSVSGNGYINGVKYKSATTAARRYATSATTAGDWAALDPSDLEIEDLACVNGWHFKAGSNLADTIGNESGSDDYAWIRNSGEFGYNGMNSGVVRDAAFFNLNTNNHNTWATYYNNGKGMLMGQGRCSTVQGDNNGYTWTNPTITSNLTDETGQDGAKYCYCNVTGYKPEGGTLQSLSSSWVFNYDYGVASDCAFYCAGNCANYMQYTYPNALAFRAALLGSVGASPAMCEANTIEIHWFDAAQTDIDANNAGVATYGEDVRTPVKAATKKGKSFKGWRFSKPEQTTTE